MQPTQSCCTVQGQTFCTWPWFGFVVLEKVVDDGGGGGDGGGGDDGDGYDDGDGGDEVG